MSHSDKKSDSPLDEVELVITQVDYEAGLKRGWTDDEMLKPGRYKFKRGGFLARHPELKLKDQKSAWMNAEGVQFSSPKMNLRATHRGSRRGCAHHRCNHD